MTKLALEQGGYDWGVLAFAVGYGGSMIWFGSSAGVAITNLFPEARSVGAWIRGGWHVAVAYVIGFFVMLMLLGWQPHEPHKPSHHSRSRQVSHEPAQAEGQRQTRLPRAPLPKQTGGAHEDKSKRPFRKVKHKKKWTDD